jgi:hypothetical protein
MQQRQRRQHRRGRPSHGPLRLPASHTLRRVRGGGVQRRRNRRWKQRQPVGRRHRAHAHDAPWRQQPRLRPRVSRAFPSWDRSILTDIYLFHARSCHAIEDGNARTGPSTAATGAAPLRCHCAPASSPRAPAAMGVSHVSVCSRACLCLSREAK